jgi:hypothetical protein
MASASVRDILDAMFLKVQKNVGASQLHIEVLPTVHYIS